MSPLRCTVLRNLVVPFVPCVVTSCHGPPWSRSRPRAGIRMDLANRVSGSKVPDHERMGFLSSQKKYKRSGCDRASSLSSSLLFLLLFPKFQTTLHLLSNLACCLALSQSLPLPQSLSVHLRHTSLQVLLQYTPGTPNSLRSISLKTSPQSLSLLSWQFRVPPELITLAGQLHRFDFLSDPSYITPAHLPTILSLLSHISFCPFADPR